MNTHLAIKLVSLAERVALAALLVQYLSSTTVEMSTVQSLRTFVNERLTAAAEEILGVFVKTVFEYEEEIDRQRRLLDVVLKPEIKLHRTGL